MRLHEKFSASSLLMYLSTLILEVPVILLRLIVAFFLAAIILALTGHSTVSAETWGDLALIPTAWSLLALAWPGGSGWWWRQKIGGREPSQRSGSPTRTPSCCCATTLRGPSPEPARWFVLDTPEPDAAVVGDALMLSRGLLDSPHLPAVLAHELGHLGSPDGRITAALNRLVIHPRSTTANPASASAASPRRWSSTTTPSSSSRSRPT
jgi:Zn-dependent protease with chaperone function